VMQLYIFVRFWAKGHRHTGPRNQKRRRILRRLGRPNRTGWASGVGGLLVLERMAFLEQVRDQEGQLDRLVGIEARIAMGVIAVLQVFRGDGAGAAGAFGDVLAGHLDMDAARMRALGAMHLEEGLHFLEDALEWSLL